MVIITKVYRSSSKLFKNVRYFKKRNFIDSMRVHVVGGVGGMGIPKYGGIGGNGGDVIIHSKTGLTLKTVLQNYPEKLIKASNGGHAHSRCIIGQRGKNHEIEVPVGISVVTDSGVVLGELDKPHQSLVIAKGGIGGCKETGFSGLKGQSHCVRLDLKMIADVGLVGFPNAGKSTILKALSNANPKIASYPFTTIKPNVGILKYSDLRELSIADLPGLIEGAHVNMGMGHRFLRHVERTKLLLFVVDINGFALSHEHEHRSCVDTVVLLMKELELYKENLMFKPSILLINKMDTDGAVEKYDKIIDSLRRIKETVKLYPDEYQPRRPIVFDCILPISAKTSVQDMNNVKDTLRNYLDLHADAGFEDVETDLVRKLSMAQKEHGPKLI